MTKTAIISGITGQDGAYLTKHLLELGGYKIVGLVRRTSLVNLSRLERLNIDLSSIEIETFDLAEPFMVQNLIRKYKPQEIYNLAAMSFVAASFEIPLYTMDTNATSVFKFVTSIMNTDPSIKFYQAGTSEMFGKVQAVPQNEDTAFYPRSPYGVAKLAAYWYVKNYRESYNFFGCNGILFNHESPLRGPEFVTRKITLGLADIFVNNGPPVTLGNLNAVRDWGHAADYVNAIHLMLQQDKPDDYIVSTNEAHTVMEFCEIAAEHLGYQLEWQGEGLDQVGVDKKTGKILIQIDQKFMRPAEVDLLLGDNSKAKKTLGWKQNYSFIDLVKEMINSDVELIRKGKS